MHPYTNESLFESYVVISGFELDRKHRFANFLLENLKEVLVLKSGTLLAKKWRLFHSTDMFHSEFCKFSEEIVAILFISHIFLVKNYTE
jgi:hypothetical protein